MVTIVELPVCVCKTMINKISSIRLSRWHARRDGKYKKDNFMNYKEEIIRISIAGIKMILRFPKQTGTYYNRK